MHLMRSIASASVMRARWPGLTQATGPTAAVSTGSPLLHSKDKAIFYAIVRQKSVLNINFRHGVTRKPFATLDHCNIVCLPIGRKIGYNTIYTEDDTDDLP